MNRHSHGELGTRKVYGGNPIFEPPWVKQIGSNSLSVTVNILKSKLQCLSTGEGKLLSVAELSGILKNRGFKKSACTVVSKELCGGAAVDPVDQTKARMAEKISFLRPPSPPRLSQGLNDKKAPPPLSEGLDPPLHSVSENDHSLLSIVHHKSLKGCILKSLLLLYCYWDMLTKNRHKEHGPSLRRMRMSQSGIRTSMFCT